MSTRRQRILKKWREQHAALRARYKSMAQEDGRGGQIAVACRQMREIERAIRSFTSERIKD